MVAVLGGMSSNMYKLMERPADGKSNVPGTSESDSTQYVRFQWSDGGMVGFGDG